MSLVYTRFMSSIGEITIQANTLGLLGVWFEKHTTQPKDLGRYCQNDPILSMTIRQLNEYLSGERQHFDIPIAVVGTDFQLAVWSILRSIPYGSVWSYQDVASAIGNPKAVRAVGAANGKNPISIIVPCHRVIGKSGKLTGYAGGVENKEKLLVLEKGKALINGKALD